MKKQIISIVLAVSMLATMFTAFMLPAVAADEITHEAFFTEDKISVDGKRDEVYLLSAPIKSVYKIKDTGNTKLGFEGYAVATKDGFYVWLEIKGDTTYVNENGKNPNSYGNSNRDYLQIYYNMSNAGNADHYGYIMHDYYNGVYFRNQAGSANNGYTATAPEGFLSAAEKTETGWVSEMFIPWFEGTPIKAAMSSGNLTGNFQIGFQYNDDYDGTGAYDCAVYDKETTSYWSDYKLMPKVVFARNFGRLSSTNVFLDGDLAIDYTVNLGAEYDIDKMFVKYTITDKDGNVETALVGGVVANAAADTYNFSYGLAPHRMNDTVYVELIYDNKVINYKDPFTVRNYCLDMYNKSAAEANQTDNENTIMKQLIVDMLNYGAKAQVFENYDTDNLVNKGFETETEDRFIKYDEIVVSDALVGYGKTHFVSTYLYFDSSNRMCFKFKTEDISKIIVTLADGSMMAAAELAPIYIPEEDAYYVVSDMIDAADYDNVFTARLYYVNNQGTDWESYTVIQSVECSVNAYLAQIVKTSQNAAMVDLAQAAYNYGQSASAFAAA